MSREFAAFTASALVLTSRATAADLAAHSAEFKRGVVKVTDGVYVAVGFGLANSILLEGKDGVVIVDTLECAEVAQQARAAFRKITTKPVKAIIYTHHHADHVFGARVFAADGKPEVYAQRLLPAAFVRSLTGVRPAVGRRSTRMYGLALGAAGAERGRWAAVGPRRTQYPGLPAAHKDICRQTRSGNCWIILAVDPRPRRDRRSPVCLAAAEKGAVVRRQLLSFLSQPVHHPRYLVPPRPRLDQQPRPHARSGCGVSGARSYPAAVRRRQRPGGVDRLPRCHPVCPRPDAARSERGQDGRRVGRFPQAAAAPGAVAVLAGVLRQGGVVDTVDLRRPSRLVRRRCRSVAAAAAEGAPRSAWRSWPAGRRRYCAVPK